MLDDSPLHGILKVPTGDISHPFFLGPSAAKRAGYKFRA